MTALVDVFLWFIDQGVEDSGQALKAHAILWMDDE